jgi:hypothetical protein
MTFTRFFRPAAMLLVPVLLSNNLVFAAKKPADPAVMKAKIQARGVGQGVRVTLADQNEAKGLIVAIGDQTFTLKPKKSMAARQIEFAQITGVHNDHLTRGQKVGITVGVTATAIAIIAIVLVVKFDNSFKNLAVFPAQR